jgi:transcriptional regulator with XRE-family HTH domain
MTSIGQRLKEERQRLGLSQAKMAEAGGVVRSAQFNYESDVRKPDAGYLALVASLGIDVQYVITGLRSSTVGEKAAGNIKNGLYGA